MNTKLKWIAGVAALIIVFVGAYFLYNKLSSEYSGDRLNTGSQQTESNQSGDKKLHPAPDFTVTDRDGNNVKLSDFKGKPVIINFWATWCGFCKQEMPDFEKAYKKYGDDIVFMMINATDGNRETVDKAKSYIDKNNFTFPVYFDTKFEANYAYGVTGLPITYFIDKDGNLIANAGGMINSSILEQGIDMITK